MDSMTDAVLMLAKGGYVMIPLALCSIISLTVLIERWVRIRHAQTDCSEPVRRAEDALHKRRTDRATEILDGCDSPATRVLAAGIRSWPLGERGAERAMEDQGTREVARLTRCFWLLDTIVTIAPLLGLLGTVTGMISAFHVIAAREGISTPTAITGGVAEALIATATGLLIAIVTLFGYNHLQERVKHVVAELETRGNAVMNLLAQIGEGPGEITSLSA